MADTDTALAGGAAPQNGIKRGADDLTDHGEAAKRPATEAASPPSEAPSTSEGDTIEIKIQFGKVSKVVRRRLASTVGELKAEIERETGVPVANQKLLFKGQLKDERCVAGAGGIDC